MVIIVPTIIFTIVVDTLNHCAIFNASKRKQLTRIKMKARINYKKLNKSNGKKYMLVCGFNDNALVYSFKENYKNGSMHSRWCCVAAKTKMSHKEFQQMAVEGMPHQEALALFNKRLGK